ncbi:MAG: nucleotide exchange factor GrpE [bacterium]
MAEPEEKKRNSTEPDPDKMEEDEILFSIENGDVGEYDIREDELEMGDDYIASALALLENYPEHIKLVIDAERVEGEGAEKTEKGQMDDGPAFASMQARITELETTLELVQSQAKKKLESQTSVIHEANQLIHKLRERCENLEKSRADAVEESEEYKRKWQETVASYMNYQKQSKKKLADFIEIEKAKIIRQFLPVIDDLRRPMDYDTPSESLLQGIKLIYRHFDNFIRSLDVRPIPALGEPFDPYNHEAVNRVPVEEGPSNLVIEELQVGYFLGDKVLRPSKVSVSFRPEAEQNVLGSALEGTEKEKIVPVAESDASASSSQDAQDIPDLDSVDVKGEDVVGEAEKESPADGSQEVQGTAENSN